MKYEQQSAAPESQPKPECCAARKALEGMYNFRNGHIGACGSTPLEECYCGRDEAVKEAERAIAAPCECERMPKLATREECEAIIKQARGKR